MARTVNLLLLTHNYPRFKGDYAGVFLSLLARRLPEFDIKPIVLAPHDNDIPEREEVDGVRIYRFRYARNPARQRLAYRGNMQEQVIGSPLGPFRLRRFLKSFERMAAEIIEREHIDIIAGHWLIPTGIVMKRLARKTSIPMMLSSHGTDIRLLAKYGPTAYRYFKPITHHVSHWTVVSSFLREKVIDLDPSLESTVQVLPLPHNEQVFYRDSAVTREDNLVVAVTRYTEQKRVDLLVRAFDWVVREEKSTRLELYGAGPLEDNIRALIEELGLERQIVMHPPVSQNDLRKVYNRAATVVLNSYQEGFGLALSEAMLCGTAVIGARSGGIVDIIEHEKRGLLVEVDNVTELAEAILRMITRRPLREKLAETGYRFARSHYASGALTAAYAGLVRDCLDTPR